MPVKATEGPDFLITLFANCNHHNAIGSEGIAGKKELTNHEKPVHFTTNLCFASSSSSGHPEKCDENELFRTDWLSELLPYIPSLLFLIPLLMVSRRPVGVSGRRGGAVWSSF